MIIEHLFFIVGVNQQIKDLPNLFITDDENKVVSDVTTQVNTVQTTSVTTQVNTVQTASVPDKLDEFKQQSTTVRTNETDSF